MQEAQKWKGLSESHWGQRSQDLEFWAQTLTLHGISFPYLRSRVSWQCLTQAG